MHSSHHHRLKAVVFVIMMMVFSVPAPANSAALSLDHSIGFYGQFQLNRWTPLTVILENSGRETSGVLEVIVTSGNEYDQNVFPAVYARDAELPTNSKKRYAFTVLIKSVSHDLIIRLRQNDNILISKSVNLRPFFIEKNFVLVADDFVSADILAVMPAHLYPVNVAPKFLPETWYGYDSVKMLIMKADTLRSLRERQYQALTQWLEQGGYLLTSGGLNTGALSQRRMQQILPVSVLGHKQVPGLSSFTDFCGRALTDTKPLLVLNARIDDSRVLVKENDIPIVFQKKLRSGQIIFLSFDYDTPQFRTWDGRGLFWGKILTVQRSIVKPEIDISDQKILDSMSAKIPAQFQSLKSVLVFIGAYLVFLRLILKRIKRDGNPAWKYSFLMVIIIIIFTAVGYGYFFAPHAVQKFTYNSFGQLEVSDGNSPASLKFYIGLYALKECAYALDFGPFFYPVTHLLSTRSHKKIPNPYVLQEYDSGQQIVGALNKWSHSFYKLNSKISAPLKGSARRDNRQLTVTVENELPHDIVGCLIYFKKRFLVVDEILAGSRQVIQLKLSNLKKTEMFNEKEFERITRAYEIGGRLSYLKISQKYLAKDVLRDIHANYQFQPDTLVLIGWMQAGMIQPDFKQNLPAGENLTLIKWELPVEMTS